MQRSCPDCDDIYSRLGTHLSRSDCEYPELSQKQKEIITGLLMGDGCISDRPDRNLYLCANMTNEKYLNWLNSNFPFYGNGVKFYRSAEKSANIAKSFGGSGNEASYNDIYKWTTMATPRLDQYADWYSSGGKRWPEIYLTPTILKNWYVCDGYLHKNGEYIVLSAANERDNSQIFEAFNEIGTSVSRVEKSEEFYNLAFTKQVTKELFEYMGDPLPGFGYKWGDAV